MGIMFICYQIGGVDGCAGSNDPEYLIQRGTDVKKSRLWSQIR